MQNLRTYTGLFLLLVLTAVACTPKIQQSAGVNAINITATKTTNPVLKSFEINPVLRLEVNIPEGSSTIALSALEGVMDAHTLSYISKLEVYATKEVYNPSEKNNLNKGQLMATLVPSGKKFSLPLTGTIASGTHHLWINVLLKNTADMDGTVQLKINKLKDAAGRQYPVMQNEVTNQPIGFALRKPMDDQVISYRIPGMATTDKGTLISVYDIRYDNSRDLPANIDVGMNRSTDGGKSWSAMKTILDMGGPKDNSGIGDPAVLFDPVSKTIWVAALWSKGNRSIAGSGPGLSPDETGQIVLTKSTDDGLTWSKPINITSQVKNPKWRIFFPGPGNGIAMADGKIVFAAQYWDADKMPHSTLIYSDDHGKSWKSGLGAKSNTTESQLVETSPGTLMLNMRDNRGKFRSVAVTKDMGMTWTEHATSYHTLPDPVCMASFIKAKVNVKGKMRDVLFFSNPNVSDSPRRNISIKASLDYGETWQAANTLLLDDRQCFGYSALTKIDDNTIGILYEGVSSLKFVRVPVQQIIK
ncbi:sialidase-1 [Pedobacter sp. CAN_A7]|uniref:exo-alpha-sialidase n=1 Tax=Pedobacter sp. CAN_A7 TaxID=2787722 RepID=UPI0018CB81A0